MKGILIWFLSVLWITTLSCMHFQTFLKTSFSSYRISKSLHIHECNTSITKQVLLAKADLLLQEQKKEKHNRAKTYYIPQYIITNALSEGHSVHDHRCIWLWPKELKLLIDALHNNRGTIVGVDEKNTIQSMFQTWNFPFHKLKNTLEYYHADAAMDDIDNIKTLTQDYTNLINTVELLCNKRFNVTRELFQVSNSFEACRSYHTCVAQE